MRFVDKKPKKERWIGRLGDLFTVDPPVIHKPPGLYVPPAKDFFLATELVFDTKTKELGWLVMTHGAYEKKLVEELEAQMKGQYVWAGRGNLQGAAEKFVQEIMANFPDQPMRVHIDTVVRRGRGFMVHEAIEVHRKLPFSFPAPLPPIQGVKTDTVIYDEMKNMLFGGPEPMVHNTAKEKTHEGRRGDGVSWQKDRSAQRMSGKRQQDGASAEPALEAGRQDLEDRRALAGDAGPDRDAGDAPRNQHRG